MSDELKQLLEELHGVTNKFDIIGEGIAGNLLDGYTVDVETSGGPILPPT